MEEQGKNRAMYNETEICIANHSKKDLSCVFISYKKEDEKVANAIGDYIMSHGVDIYLDTRDFVLQEAVSVENDRKIVQSINKGIETCTDLLCLVSDKTKLSWWVPYEVGVAGKIGLKISTLKLKSVDDVPSFLKTEKVLQTAKEFFDYIRDLYPRAGLPSTRKYSSDCTVLAEYIDE